MSEIEGFVREFINDPEDHHAAFTALKSIMFDIIGPEPHVVDQQAWELWTKIHERIHDQ